jgi:predicted ester cyclase
MSQTLKESVRWFFLEVFNKGNFVPIDDLIGDNYTFNGQAQTGDQIKQWVTFLRTSLQGLTFTVNDLLQDGSQVAIRWTLVGTDATTKVLMTNTGTNILTFVDGKAVSNWQNGGTPQDIHPAQQSVPAAA